MFSCFYLKYSRNKVSLQLFQAMFLDSSAVEISTEIVFRNSKFWLPLESFDWVVIYLIRENRPMTELMTLVVLNETHWTLRKNPTKTPTTLLPPGHNRRGNVVMTTLCAVTSTNWKRPGKNSINCKQHDVTILTVVSHINLPWTFLCVFLHVPSRHFSVVFSLSAPKHLSAPGLWGKITLLCGFSELSHLLISAIVVPVHHMTQGMM